MPEYLLWALLYWGTAIYDVETTQSCLNRATCVEANPLILSHTRPGMYLQKGLVFAPLAFWAYKRPQSSGPKWALGITSTAQGVVGTLNLRF